MRIAPLSRKRSTHGFARGRSETRYHSFALDHRSARPIRLAVAPARRSQNGREFALVAKASGPTRADLLRTPRQRSQRGGSGHAENERSSGTGDCHASRIPYAWQLRAGIRAVDRRHAPRVQEGDDETSPAPLIVWREMGRTACPSAYLPNLAYAAIRLQQWERPRHDWRGGWLMSAAFHNRKGWMRACAAPCTADGHILIKGEPTYDPPPYDPPRLSQRPGPSDRARTRPRRRFERDG